MHSYSFTFSVINSVQITSTIVHVRCDGLKGHSIRIHLLCQQSTRPNPFDDAGYSLRGSKGHSISIDWGNGFVNPYIRRARRRVAGSETKEQLVAALRGKDMARALPVSYSVILCLALNFTSLRGKGCIESLCIFFSYSQSSRGCIGYVIHVFLTIVDFFFLFYVLYLFLSVFYVFPLVCYVLFHLLRISQSVCVCLLCSSLRIR